MPFQLSIWECFFQKRTILIKTIKHNKHMFYVMSQCQFSIIHRFRKVSYKDSLLLRNRLLHRTVHCKDTPRHVIWSYGHHWQESCFRTEWISPLYVGHSHVLQKKNRRRQEFPNNNIYKIEYHHYTLTWYPLSNCNDYVEYSLFTNVKII